MGDLYAGALIPGLMLTGLYGLYIAALAIFRPEKVPALPKAARSLSGSPVSLLVLILSAAAAGALAYWPLSPSYIMGAGIWAATLAAILAYGVALVDEKTKFEILSPLARRVVFSLLPPLALIFLVLGTIFLGIATPTKAVRWALPVRSRSPWRAAA